MKGIAPRVLASQVQATAAWALDAPLAPARVVLDAERIEAVWAEDPQHIDYFKILLAAHYLTVGTFCPTDVDARIRHHVWSELEDFDRFREAVDEVDAIAALDPRLVSARVLVSPDMKHLPVGAGETLSGHNGEWFSVRAGALGRALVIGSPDAERLQAAIEDELVREAAIFETRVREDDVVGALSAATILAHNTGDLSRVVEAWPAAAAPAVATTRHRFSRLGHEPDRSRWGGTFFVAGEVNKKVMAIENHRFLALRKPRALRQSRALLLPIGPFFDAWGKQVARSLEEEDRAEVVAALLETHLRGPEQQGALRGLAGIMEGSSGPWDRIVAHLPARLRKVATTGVVPTAIRAPERAFLARLENRYRVALREAQAQLTAAAT